MPFFTNLIIQLHANKPEAKAAIKPTTKIDVSILAAVETSVLKMLSIFSPIIGTRTIKKENLATSDFLFPNNKPVAMVEPEREIPGITAKVCATPIIKASRKLISFSFA